MKISNGRKVTIEFCLKDIDGMVLEASKGTPLQYIQGTGDIVSGLESALIGKRIGFSSKVSVSPDKAYGYRDEGLVQKLPIERFRSLEGLKVGTCLTANSGNKEVLYLVKDLTSSHVTVDGNHPYAGKTLFFDVKVLDVGAFTPNSDECSSVDLTNSGCSCC
ncbi:peptidylprolyl isomerase [bacterium]|nr:peptidylprolyl isomerase [bacterium]